MINMAKMNPVLTKYKEECGDTYKEIAKFAGITTDRVIKCFRNPGGVGAKTMVGVAKAIHMPLQEAKKMWMDHHMSREKSTRLEKWERAIAK